MLFRIVASVVCLGVVLAAVVGDDTSRCLCVFVLVRLSIDSKPFGRVSFARLVADTGTGATYPIAVGVTGVLTQIVRGATPALGLMASRR